MFTLYFEIYSLRFDLHVEAFMYVMIHGFLASVLQTVPSYMETYTGFWQGKVKPVRSNLNIRRYIIKLALFVPKISYIKYSHTKLDFFFVFKNIIIP